MTDETATRNGALVGNRLALTGAIIYLLEWVAIIGTPPPGPFSPGTPTAEVIEAYAANAGEAAFSAGFFAVCLLGRVLFLGGVKASVRNRARALPLLDVAIAAMAVSVALEIAGYGIAAAAGRLAADGGAETLVLALDGASYWLTIMIFGPAGFAVLAAALGMSRSGLYPSWLCWLALVAGAGMTIGGVLTTVGAGGDGGGAGEAVAGLAVPLMWLWMLVTGVRLWRRTA